MQDNPSSPQNNPIPPENAQDPPSSRLPPEPLLLEEPEDHEGIDLFVLLNNSPKPKPKVPQNPPPPRNPPPQQNPQALGPERKASVPVYLTPGSNLRPSRRRPPPTFGERRPLPGVEGSLSTLDIRLNYGDTHLLGSLFVWPRTQTIQNLAERLQGLPSPGPSRTIFDIGTIPDRWERANLLPAHPQHLYLDRGEHPNPTGTPALQSVRSSGLSIRMDRPRKCQEVNTDWAKKGCQRQTPYCCVDISHGLPTHVCPECHVQSRRVVGQALIAIAPILRAYACSDCSKNITPESFRNMQFNVWGFPLDAFNDFQGERVPISRGPILEPITACSCSAKLVDMHLCSAHRAYHLLDMRERAQAMRRFVSSTFGCDMICPICLTNPGADATNFLDQQGNPCEKIVFICMACLGFVVTDPETHASIDTLGQVF